MIISRPIETIKPLKTLTTLSYPTFKNNGGNHEWSFDHYYHTTITDKEKLPQNYTIKGYFSILLSILQRVLHLYKQQWDCFKVRHFGLLGKRAFDVVMSAIILLMLLPFFLVICLLIRLDSSGPLLFSQKRIGKDGKAFVMWKFRSMYSDAEQRKASLMRYNEMKGGVSFKMKNDPRITRMGKFIRKFSIDELPQFWNVLIGDMSLVGPRPPLPNEVEKYTPYQRQRLGITPGITCIWQVSGRSEIPFQQQVELDLQYIATQSFSKDILLLFKTIPAVLKGKGAY